MHVTANGSTSLQKNVLQSTIMNATNIPQSLHWKIFIVHFEIIVSLAYAQEDATGLLTELAL
jgi:hypothetical protein